MSFGRNGSCYYSAIILCDYSAISLCEFPVQCWPNVIYQYYNFSAITKLAMVQLIEKVEEINKNIKTWGWGRRVFKL